ncbi:MAG: hypothetical protein K5651_01455 [Bacteroidales bacterium]|nr:hypothetical protein [Bacteroidales bacterium]
MALNLKEVIGVAVSEKNGPETLIDGHDIIMAMVNINYPKTIKYAQSAAIFVKAAKLILPSLSVLEKAAIEYKSSDLDISDRDEQYIQTLKNNLDIPFLIQTLTPIANSLPAGELLLKLLESFNTKKDN